ncbi:UNVERIFIED_CONTAM: hypothetical protein HDU68_002677 [Siphonaria sp. JEL0065]|nr:hypothetical protein HDU68_002677 [Siphonaria sp. JEL0065]
MQDQLVMIDSLKPLKHYRDRVKSPANSQASVQTSAVSATIIVSDKIKNNSIADVPAHATVSTATKLLPKKKFNILDWVDPRIGTAGDGHVWLGSTVPNGMIKVGIDCDHKEPGFHETLPIIGISHTHVSGTGGGRSYQNMVLTPHWTINRPTLTNTTNPLNIATPLFESNRTNETVLPGFYAVNLTTPLIHVSLTSSNRFAKHKWAFYPSQILKTLRTGNSSSVENSTLTLHALMKVKHPSMGFISGTVKANGEKIMVSGKYQDTWSSSFGIARNHAKYDVFSCMSTSTKFQRYGAVSNGEEVNSADQEEVGVESKYSVGLFDYSGGGENVGGYLSFDFDTSKSLNDSKRVELVLDVGISFHSVEKACKHLADAQKETFEETVEKNAESWKNVMTPIMVEKPLLRPEDTKIMYSSLYRVFFMPANRTGENLNWPNTTQSEPYFDDFYCIWDTFRTLNPLLTIIAPKLQAGFINSLLSSAKYARGFLGDSHVGNAYGITQGGNNAEILIAEAYVKNISGIDYASAFEVIKYGTENESPISRLIEGRGDIQEYNSLGFVPKKDISRIPYFLSSNSPRVKSISVSRTVEYAYADFTISQMAREFGNETDYAMFLKRSGNWKNLWDNSTKDEGFVGFLQPRGDVSRVRPVGARSNDPPSFIFMNPKLGSPLLPDSGVMEFYEDSSWAYSFFAPQNIKTLIEYMNGTETFEKRLDTFFDLGIYDPGNEPAFLVPTLYHYIGKPNLSVKRIDAIAEKHFTSKADGIPGNDDAAAMASWFLVSALGLFPVAGQDIYLLLAPRFEKTTIRVGADGEREFVIIVKGKGRVIQKVSLNGKNLSRSYIYHKEIVGGGKLEFVVGNSESDWGSGKGDVPPSYNDLISKD